MASYVIRRLLAMIPALLGIATITFLLMHLTPGGPFSSEHSDPLVRAAQLRAYHLDEPIWPTFVGPGAEPSKVLVLVLALLTLGGGIFLLTDAHQFIAGWFCFGLAGLITLRVLMKS